MNKSKFTDFLGFNKTINLSNKYMHKLKLTGRLAKYVLSFVLLLGSTVAYSQSCAPRVKLADGTWSEVGGVFCEGELIEFEANSPGFTTTVNWDFGDAASSTSTEQDPIFGYPTAGNFTVTFTGNGFNGNCTETLNIVVKPSPTIRLSLINADTQCFRTNEFCFRDTSNAPDGKIVRQTYVFSNGTRIDYLNPTHNDVGGDNFIDTTFCVVISDPTGGFFDLTIESEDSSGCITRIVLREYIYIFPRLGIEFINVTPGPNPGCDSTLGRYRNISTVSFADVDSFMWVFGDGDSIVGNATTNSEWWNGPANDGIVEHMYTTQGTFDGTLIATAFGCTDTFIWNAAVANIVLEPTIISTPNPACTPDNPITFTPTNLPSTPGVSSFLWNYGDPPAGPANFNDRTLVGSKSYGPGVWMASLRLRAGPCDRTFYDTVQVVGPGSTIEVAFDRVPQTQTYQCVIRDTVCFPNNSSFYQNDYNTQDEDSFIFYGDYTFDREYDNTTGLYDFFFREWEEDRNANRIVNETKFGATDTITEQGFKVFYSPTKDSLAVIDLLSGDTTWTATDYGLVGSRNYRYIVNPRKRWVFNYTPPPGGAGVGIGDQTAIPLPNPIREMNPNVWRVWTMGDRFAPQCTTDMRPWVNQNVGLNCNYRIDEKPCHWYTPWDEIYETFQDGRNYSQPLTQTRLFKEDTFCYQVNVYPAAVIIIPGDTILTVPIDSSLTYQGVTIPPGVEYPKGKLGNWTVRRTLSCFVGTEVYFDVLKDSFVAVNNYTDTTYHSRDWLGDNNPKNQNGSTKWTAAYHELDLDVPAGVTIDILQLTPAGNGGGGGGPAPGTVTTFTGPGIATIEADQQFTVRSKDQVCVVTKIEANEPDTSFAQPSLVPSKQLRFGIPVTVTTPQIFVDSAAHRDDWMLENANCYNVTLWQMDTLHPLMCESTGTKSLALTPPNAKGLELVAGTPCPFTAGRNEYVLTFDISNTKPGCTQNWFAVNLDTFTFPANEEASWTVYNGGLLAPPAPGSPIPFALPYDLVGNLGTTFVKGYTPTEVESSDIRQPVGSFTLGLVVGNGMPLPGGGNQHPSAECIDTAYFPDLFRILFLDSDFDIVLPTGGDCRYMCPGDTAFFRINSPIQDSIESLTWNWGYDAGANPTGRGPEFSQYNETFKYFEPYTGPVAGRNDKDIVYNGEDWLYNYVIRATNTSYDGVVTLDTIVISILKDWKVIADKRFGNQIVTEAFDRILGLDYNEIPAEDVPFYLGDGTFGCLDSSGLSQFFRFGNAAYHQKADSTVWQIDDKRFRCVSYVPVQLNDTTFFTDVSGNRIASITHSGIDSFTNIELIPNYNRDDCIDVVEVTHILHWRDSSLAGFDTLLVDTNNNGQLDTLAGLYRHIYRYPEVVGNEDPCDPLSEPKLVYRNANGPMNPQLFLSSTVGCNQRTTKPLNVGFYNDFWVEDNTICEELNIIIEDSLRYYQCGEEDPRTFPISDFPIWQDNFGVGPERYIADYDSTDGLNFDPSNASLILNHTYTEPGKYVVSIQTQDSIGCTDTAYETILVTKLNPYFALPDSIRNCAGVMNFVDSSWFVDPCLEICDNGDTINQGCEETIQWEWDFGDGTRTSILENPSHNFTQGGEFTVTLRVWSLLGCEEEFSRIIRIPGPQPVFEFDLNAFEAIDTATLCVGDSVFLNNISRGDINAPTFRMDWGDGTQTNVPDIGGKFGYAYPAAGIYELYMTQQDEVPGTGDRCTRQFPDTSEDQVTITKKIVVVLPRPPVTIEVEDDTVCVNQLVNLEGILDPRYIRLRWELGDGNEINRNVPDNRISYSYGQKGDYSIVLAPEYDELPRCWDTDTISIHVLDVTADFSIDSSSKPLFKFTETATGGNTFDWTFEDDPEGTASGETAEYNWGIQKGRFEVCLIVRELKFGCEDTICKPVDNSFIPILTPYNVFTPNGDGFNDEFIIENQEVENYTIKIFNRWGERVFISENPDEHWNGQVNNDGTDCPEGTYFYILTYNFNFGEENEPIEGTVELIRNEAK